VWVIPVPLFQIQLFAQNHHASPWLARGGVDFVRTQNGMEVTPRYDVEERTVTL
jgi:hypothetical protein